MIKLKQLLVTAVHDTYLHDLFSRLHGLEAKHRWLVYFALLVASRESGNILYRDNIALFPTNHQQVKGMRDLTFENYESITRFQSYAWTRSRSNMLGSVLHSKAAEAQRKQNQDKTPHTLKVQHPFTPIQQ